ncbi:hypothetical protein AVEN_255618-1 [Araneus ventricosus]|uniref:Uncharacterized protein n=1 Tax=Araneus ventricosus TaxID=182803 RepID=A0A4Y2U779_ARAVE|nr:hypothetical protein AVEN_255618-1 [Araneus ventricosus]
MDASHIMLAGFDSCACKAGFISRQYSPKKKSLPSLKLYRCKCSRLRHSASSVLFRQFFFGTQRENKLSCTHFREQCPRQRSIGNVATLPLFIQRRATNNYCRFHNTEQVEEVTGLSTSGFHIDETCSPVLKHLHPSFHIGTVNTVFTVNFHHLRMDLQLLPFAKKEILSQPATLLQLTTCTDTTAILIYV